MNDDEDGNTIELDGTKGPVTVSPGPILVIDPAQMEDGVTYLVPFSPEQRLGFCMIEGVIEMIPYAPA